MDLVDDREALRRYVQSTVPGVRVHLVTTIGETGICELEAAMVPQETYALVGSSGVGKSSIAQMLVAGVEIATAPIRESDDTGQHTTSQRALFATTNGCWLIDSPGIRELELVPDTQALARTFFEITEVAQECRFRDCSHSDEPHCAVRAALEAEEIQLRRLQSYQKLRKEMEAALQVQATGKRKRNQR